jgi:hypothetical protein
MAPMAISDIVVLADLEALFGPVASDSTRWRLLEALDDAALAAIAAARAWAREVAWAQRAEATGAAFGRSRVAGTAGVEALVIDLDAHIVVCHSEKQLAAPTFKTHLRLPPAVGVSGPHRRVPGWPAAAGQRQRSRLEHRGRSHRGARRRPGPAAGSLPAWASEPDPGRRRGPHQDVPRPRLLAGRAGHQLRVLRRLDHHRAGTRRHRRARGRRLDPAVDTDGTPRPLDEAAVAEITGLLPPHTRADYPAGTR